MILALKVIRSQAETVFLAQQKISEIQNEFLEKCSHLQKTIEILCNLLLDTRLQQELASVHTRINSDWVNTDKWGPEFYFERNAVGFRFQIPQIKSGLRPHPSHPKNYYEFIKPVLYGIHQFLETHQKQFPIQIKDVHEFLSHDKNIYREGKTLFEVAPHRIESYIHHPQYRYFGLNSKLVWLNGYLKNFVLMFELTK